MYGNSKLFSSTVSPIKPKMRNNKTPSKSQMNNNNINNMNNLNNLTEDTDKSNLKNIDLLSYKDISKDPKMASYVIGANLLGIKKGHSSKKSLDFNSTQNPFLDDRNLFSPSKTNLIRGSTRGQSSNNISMSLKNFDEISNISKIIEKKSNRNITNNPRNDNESSEKISPKLLMMDMEQDFKSIFNRTKKGLNIKNELFEKIQGEKTQGEKVTILSDIHIENKEKYKNNLNSVDYNKDFNEDLSNKINKLELSKKMKTKFKDINSLTENMKNIIDKKDGSNREKDLGNNGSSFNNKNESLNFSSKKKEEIIGNKNKEKKINVLEKSK